MEVTASNIDKLATIEARTGGRKDRGIIQPLYEAARAKLNDKPLSLAAAERLREAINPGDSVIVSCGMASLPAVPFGETDGPLGVASLARAIRFGLGGLPIIVTNELDMEPLRQTVKAAGLNILDFQDCHKTKSGVATSIIFPTTAEEESKEFAASIINKYNPKALIAVELIGPNRKGYKHYSPGLPFEAIQKAARIEHLFYEASARGILTIACFDQGNEIGGGTIEDTVRDLVPYGAKCQCECGDGMACAVKADIAFPAAVSNWGAYAIVAVLGLLLNDPELLQDAKTEQRMMEECVMAGSIDGVTGKALPSVDGIDCASHQAYITILHTIIRNALSGAVINFTKK